MSLRGLGKLWLTSPVDLSERARALLWHRSRQVKQLDIFYSHTWHTPGWRKVLALWVQHGAWKFLLGWLLGVILGVALDATMEIPTLVLPGPSIWIGGFLGSMLGLLTSPYTAAWAACRRKAEEMCFLDVVCINQTDPDTMQRGIYGLGGFLAASSEMHILWSGPYFSRLWCVFELAAFFKANPCGKILLKPLFVENGLLFVVFAIYILRVIDEWFVNNFQERTVVAILVQVLGLIPSYMLVHFLRRLLNEKHHLLYSLRSFDLANVTCRCAADKECIEHVIRTWYGSPASFMQHVRGPLADELTKPFSRNNLPGSFWLMIATPFVSFNMAGFWVERRMPTSSTDDVAKMFLTVCIANSVLCVHYIQLTYFICDRFAAPAGRCLDYGKTLLIWVCLSFVFLGMFGLSSFVRRQVLAASVMYAVATVAMSFVITHNSWRRRFRASPPEEAIEI